MTLDLVSELDESNCCLRSCNGHSKVMLYVSEGLTLSAGALRSPERRLAGEAFMVASVLFLASPLNTLLMVKMSKVANEVPRVEGAVRGSYGMKALPDAPVLLSMPARAMQMKLRPKANAD